MLFRKDINGEIKSYTPIPLSKIPPYVLHKDLLFIPSLNARIFESMYQELHDYQIEVAKMAENFFNAREDLEIDHQKMLHSFFARLV